MSTKKHHKTAQKYKERNIRFSISLVIFFILWLLFLFFGLPSKVTISLNAKHNLPTSKLLQNSSKPHCKHNVSFFIYQLPEKFNRGLLQSCKHLSVYTNMCPHLENGGLGQPLLEMGSTSWFATHQFLAEMIFHARLENHPCRTWDPELANLFYVPFYGGLHASSKFRESDYHARDELSIKLSEYISRQPWWRFNNGVDHFMVLGRTAWDFMRSEYGPDFGANTLLFLPPVKNMSVLTIERHPWKDLNLHGIPYPSYFHPTTSEEMLMWQDKIGRMKRPHLFSFAGAPRINVQKAEIRNEIIKQCEVSAKCKLLKCGHGASKCHNPSEVLKLMTSSQFCLQPPGDSFTRRSTFDAFLAGCIPVFFSPHTAYSQYAWFLPANSDSYSVYIDGEGAPAKKIEEELLKIPMERVRTMRKTVIDLIPKLTYVHPNATNYRFPDAVDVALAAVRKHMEHKLWS